MLEEGDPAPEITAPNQHGESVTVDTDGPTVLYFYPEDGTPGCTTEAEQFTLEKDSYDDAGVTVYGVSTDSVDSHAEFAAETGVAFDLLADPDGDVAEAFGLDATDGFVERVTFVLADGEVVADVDADNVNPEGHAAAVLEAVEEH